MSDVRAYINSLNRNMNDLVRDVNDKDKDIMALLSKSPDEFKDIAGGTWKDAIKLAFIAGWATRKVNHPLF